MTAAKPTVKLHLAAIRMLFDWLVVGQVLAVNPAHAVCMAHQQITYVTAKSTKRCLTSVSFLEDKRNASKLWEQ